VGKRICCRLLNAGPRLHPSCLASPLSSIFERRCSWCVCNMSMRCSWPSSQVYHLSFRQPSLITDFQIVHATCVVRYEHHSIEHLATEWLKGGVVSKLTSSRIGGGSFRWVYSDSCNRNYIGTGYLYLTHKLFPDGLQMLRCKWSAPQIHRPRPTSFKLKRSLSRSWCRKSFFIHTIRLVSGIISVRICTWYFQIYSDR